MKGFISFRDVYPDCDYRMGAIVEDIQPMNHLDKLGKYLDDKGGMTVLLLGCTHPDSLNDYCSSACPLMAGL